jgi:hypothetical protein
MMIDPNIMRFDDANDGCCQENPRKEEGENITICVDCYFYIESAPCFGKYVKNLVIEEYAMCGFNGGAARRVDPVTGKLALVKKYPDCRDINNGSCANFIKDAV